MSAVSAARHIIIFVSLWEVPSIGRRQELLAPPDGAGRADYTGWLPGTRGTIGLCRSDYADCAA